MPVQTVLEDAARAGVFAAPAQRIELKKAYQGIRGKGRHALPQWKQPSQATVAGTRDVIAVDNVFEHESNDGWQWADDMAGDVATGDCSLVNDVDSWRFAAPAAGFYTFEVRAAAGGVFPIADSLLTLRNQKGDPIASDDNGNGLLSRINIFLPAGTYYLDVTGYNGFGGGEYDLVAQVDPVNIAPLGVAGVTGTTQIPVGGVAHDVFEVTVADSHVEMIVDSLGNDTAMVVQRADGLILFSNDDSFLGGLDAAADLDLPAGSYYVYVWDIAGGAGLSYNLSFSDAPMVFDDLLTSVVSTSSILGDETMRLGRIHLAAPQHIDVMSDDSGAFPVGDTIMALLDRDLDYVCDVDDDDPFNNARGFYSRIAMSLPAGDYWIAVSPYPGAFGDFQLTAVGSAYAPTGVGAFGGMAASIPGFGDIATYVLDNSTQASCQVTGTDFWFGVLGPDGELATNTRCASFHPQAGELPRGACTVFAWDRYDFSSVMDVAIVPPLHLAADGVTLQTRAKEGDQVWLFANFSGLTPGFNFGVGDRGLLCLPLDAALLTIGDRIAPADGLNIWLTVPPGITGVQLQSGDLHMNVGWPAPAFGTWRNTLGL
ncbi:MAG: hypothetical protein AB7O97_24365 [Planctomycetota bacterium]